VNRTDTPLAKQQLTLAQALKRFRAWAATGPEGSYGEWECDYEHWDEIWASFDTAIDEFSPAASAEDILYAIARDNEIEELRRRLTLRTDSLLLLASAAISCPEKDARWQIAVSLGEVGSAEAIKLLSEFVRDSDEYVRRRALLAYAPHRPCEAEPIAWEWISSTEPYSRLAALHVLRDIQSTHLPSAIQILRDDPFDIVRQRAIEFSQVQQSNDNDRNG
jgi:HEAT repeat protein